MRGTIKSLTIITLVFAYFSAAAVETVVPNYIDMSKISDTNYIFESCSLGKCRVIGNPAGYTYQEIMSQDGRWEQIAGIGMLVGGAIPIVTFSGLWWGTLAADEGSTITAAGLFGMTSSDTWSTVGAAIGGATGVSMPIAALYFMDSLNPLSYLRDGRMKVKMQKNAQALDKAFKNGNLKVLLAQDQNPAKIEQTTAQVERLLHNLDFWRQNPLPADINSNPAAGSSTFEGI